MIIKMNFDSRHVIRWGIPGWVFLLSILLYIFFDTPKYLVDLKGKDGLSIIGLGAMLAGSGVPIGYLIHQISMLFGFIIKNKRIRYFKEEYEIDKLFFTNSNGDKMRTRYVHLLTRVHELRALKYSHLLSLLVILILGIYQKHINSYLYISVSINLGLLLIVHFNQKYFNDNLNYYKKQIKQNP
jgi:hypothetical protein